jgi:phosphorylase superfamily
MYLPFDGEHLNYAKSPIFLPSLAINLGKREDWIHHEGFCLTGDQFIDDTEKVRELREQTGAHVVEMEAFAVASVAREF